MGFYRLSEWHSVALLLCEKSQLSRSLWQVNQRAEVEFTTPVWLFSSHENLHPCHNLGWVSRSILEPDCLKNIFVFLTYSQVPIINVAVKAGFISSHLLVAWADVKWGPKVRVAVLWMRSCCLIRQHASTGQHSLVASESGFCSLVRGDNNRSGWEDLPYHIQRFAFWFVLKLVSCLACPWNKMSFSIRVWCRNKIQMTALRKPIE